MAKEKVNWKIAVYDADGPLDEGQIARLAAQFELDSKALRSLSSELSWPLHPSTRVRGIFKVSDGEKPGRAPLEMAIEKVTKAKSLIEEAKAAWDAHSA